MAYFRRRGCKCPKDPKTNKVKRCTCGAKWSYTIDLDPDPATGERRQETKGGFATRDEAIEAANRVYVDRKDGTYIQRSAMLFKDFVPLWFNEYKISGRVKISTIAARESVLQHFLNPLSFMKLRDITTEKYQSILDKLKEEGYSKNSLTSIHAVGNMIFNAAIAKKKLKESPAKAAIMPIFQDTVEDLERKEEIAKYLEKEELALFLKTAEERGKPGDYEIFFTMAYTGIRVGEICASKDIDVDLELGKISIRRTYYRNTKIKEYVLLTPKTKSSVRTIEIDLDVIAVLKRNDKRLKELKMKYRTTYIDAGFLFVNTSQKRAGLPMATYTVRKRMKRLLKLAGLDTSLTPHSLRHTHTSLLAEAGVSLEEIMERLGHENDRITKKIYLHVTKARKKLASEKFSQLMRSVKI